MYVNDILKRLGYWRPWHDSAPTPADVTLLNKILNEYKLKRWERLALISELVRRPITSTRHLTYGEVWAIIRLAHHSKLSRQFDELLLNTIKVIRERRITVAAQSNNVDDKVTPGDITGRLTRSRLTVIQYLVTMNGYITNEAFEGKYDNETVLGWLLAEGYIERWGSDWNDCLIFSTTKGYEWLKDNE